jgi:competence protein ComFC
MSVISPFIRSLADFLWPKSRKVLELEALSSAELIRILPQSSLNDESVCAIFSYQDPKVKEIVWEVKYNGNRVLADKLGEILYDFVTSELEDHNIFEKGEVLLIPIPISDKRRFERGWNQTELLAKAVKLRDSGNRFKYLPRALTRYRHTESQTKAESKKERQENIENSMRATIPLPKESYVVLIDDVTTTGATFKEAKRALLEAGVRKIFCFAVAH